MVSVLGHFTAIGVREDYCTSAHRQFIGRYSRTARKSHIQAHRIDQDEQNAGNIDDDADKHPDDVEPVLLRGVPDRRKVQSAHASTAPVGQRSVFGQGVPLKLRAVDRAVN